MKKCMPAHLRRACALLDWLDTEQAEAQVVWCGNKIGSWRSIRPCWKLEGTRIRLHFSLSGRNREFWISTVRTTQCGADIHLAFPGRPMPEPLSLVWREEDAKCSVENESRGIGHFILGWSRLRFPGCRVVSIQKRSDRAHSLSGSFFRILLRHQDRNLFMVLVPAEHSDAVHSALTQAILWISHHPRRNRHVPVVQILVPTGCASVLCHRARYLKPDRIRASIWEYCRDSGGNWQVHPARTPEPPAENRDFRWPVLGPFRWSAALERVLDLAPASIRRYPRFQDYDSLRLWGLEFARVMGEKRDRLQFGVGSTQVELCEDNFDSLKCLVDEILFYRRPDSTNTHHPYYRMQAERWLECLILEEIPRLFPELHPESAYPQIPVYLDNYPGRVDILGADRAGRMVIMELKVTQDADQPLQALDYWGRVIHHNQSGDFKRRGYFSEIPLDQRPPKIYLVSPVFSFHDSTETVTSYADSAIEIWKVSINEDWRSGVKILRRVRLRC